MDYIERLSAEIILVIVVGFASIGGILWFWPSPLTALIIAAAFVALFFAYDLYVKYGDEEAKAPNGAYDLIPILILGIFMLPLAGWSLGQVRANLLEYVGPYSATVSGRALNDGALSVRAIACSSITIHHNDSVNFENLPNHLDKDTRTSFKCLKRLKKKAQSKAAEGMLSGHKLLADRLAGRWWKALMNQSKLSKSKSCASAEIMTYAYQYTNSNWRERLFTCSLAAPSSSARSCCQEEAKIREEPVFDYMSSSPNHIAPDLAKKYFPKFVEAALEEANQESTPVNLPEKLDRTSLQDWTMALGCRFISLPSFRDKLIDAYSSLLNTCTNESIESDQFYSDSNWIGLCQGLYISSREYLGHGPSDAVCSGLGHAAIHYSASEASSTVAKAISEAAFEANGSELNLSGEKVGPIGGGTQFGGPGGVGNSDLGNLFRGMMP
jgi:hypothetical protein